MSLRVLHVVRDLGLESGGPARAVLQLATTLRRHDVEVTLAAHQARGAQTVALEWLPLEVPTLAAARALGRAIAWADLVHVHGLWNHTVSLASVLCQRRGVPYVVTPHGMLDPVCLAHHRRRKQAYAHLVGRRTMVRAGGFHFLSEEERDRAVMPATCADRPAVVAPNAASVPPPSSSGVLHARFPELAGRQVVMSLGRLDRIKGIDLQLDALAQIPRSLRPMLLVVGPDFGDEARLKSLAKRTDLEPWVVWAGPVYGDERFALMRDADLVVLTSVYDCNPMVIPEGLSAGAVVAATETCGGVAAAAREGAAVIMRRTPEAVAETIRAVLGDRDRRTRLRMKARTYAATALDPDVLVEPLVGLYAGLAGALPFTVLHATRQSPAARAVARRSAR